MSSKLSVTRDVAMLTRAIVMKAWVAISHAAKRRRIRKIHFNKTAQTPLINRKRKPVKNVEQKDVENRKKHVGEKLTKREAHQRAFFHPWRVEAWEKGGQNPPNETNVNVLAWCQWLQRQANALETTSFVSFY